MDTENADISRFAAYILLQWQARRKDSACQVDVPQEKALQFYLQPGDWKDKNENVSQLPPKHSERSKLGIWSATESQKNVAASSVM